MSKPAPSSAAAYPVAVVVDDQGPYMNHTDASTPPAQTHEEAEAETRLGLVGSAASTIGNGFLLVLLSGLTMGFAIAAFVFVLVGLVVGIGLLPAACAGLLVLSVFSCLLRPIAKLDEMLFLHRKALYDNIFNHNVRND
ncbi:Aste57867_23884 [Aphanomyces stellatus]|uniref:Aste57867_23884 protein n=1 Tax=Aphanomyces stellatus TaxID=120398 RepID=A0A485LNZ7_9STRA|nr:hypothetical protein As57867_023811 [Aphanomyces stellatus]VFU00527.1 Aste57867_23884 [Aphanomyces stellatus]